MDHHRVLYVSGSLGLGHVTRDLAIALELRRQLPGVEISWLAAHPASMLLEQAGEPVVPEAAAYANENELAELSAQGSSLNLLRYLIRARGAWGQNVAVFSRLVKTTPFDLVIGDETYELTLALRENRRLKTFKFVMIFDFVGLEAMTANPLENLGVYIWNRKWSHDFRMRRPPSYDLGLFVGEAEDVPDAPFGIGLPNRRAFAEAMYRFVGFVFPFDPRDLMDRVEVRRRLGYGDTPLVIASIGGTSIGRHLLELCGAAYRHIQAKMPSLRLVLVAGPRLGADTVKIPPGVEIRQFIPDLYQHFAACDVAIVQGGATSTLEVAALRRPFVYFPLEGHSEQAGVAKMLTRRGAGTPMQFSRTTPEELAGKVLGLLGSEVSHPVIPADGARRAASLIAGLLAGPDSD